MVTSSAISAAAAMDSGEVTIEYEGDDAVVVPVLGVAGGGVDLGGAAFEGLVHEVGAEAAVGTGDEHGGSVEGGHVSFLAVGGCGCWLRACAWGYVLESDASLREGLSVVGARNGDFPQLLDRTLMDGECDNLCAAAVGAADEVGGVVNTHGYLAESLDGEACANACGRLDGGEEDSTVDNAPWCVVLWSEVDVTCDAVWTHLVDHEPGSQQKRALFSVRIDLA
jgi:hypothetical protein